MQACRLDEEAIYHEARRLGEPAAREAYLREACGDDTALRERVAALVGVLEREPGFLEPADAGLWPTLALGQPAPAEGVGAAIGPYTLREVIGEGGMGTVYLAEQAEPVRRKVALKVIKPGMDSKQVIGRFEAERQALALMDHPNIARVLDGGTTANGRPYFVMELVRGIPITQYCDRGGLSIRERLELFVLVCRAVQHAHQKGVIHRDLKPSNVLVTEIDGAAVPKVIDFGVAKAIGEPLVEGTLCTGFAQMVGTPLYMSPEQAGLSGQDIDTRADIYSLGVLLYELLAGTTPFDPGALREAGFDEIRRILREEEPPTPSTRLGSLGATLTPVSARRGTDPRQLYRAVRGELDWIAMRAIEKDRRRRYETANGLAADVMRYLTDQPVEACPPSAWYRVAKYARRHRAAVTTAALVGLALIAGTAASTREAVRATRAQRQAEAHLALGLDAIDALYEQVAGLWLGDLLWLPLPRPFLERALQFYARFGVGDPDDPSVGHADRRIGEILLQLDRRDEALAYFRRAKATWQGLLARHPGNPDYARELAACREAEAMLATTWGPKQAAFEEAIALHEGLVRRRPDVSLHARELAYDHRHLGGHAVNWGRWSVADAHLARAREILERLCAASPGDPDLRLELGTTLRLLGEKDVKTGRFDLAEPLVRCALGLHEALVVDCPTKEKYYLHLGWTLRTLGWILLGTGRDAEAAAVAERGARLFEGLRTSLPEVRSLHQEITDHLSTLAITQVRQGDRAGLDGTLGRIERLATDHFMSMRLADLARDLARGEPSDLAAEAAVRAASRAVALQPSSASAWGAMGAARYRAGRPDEAIAALTRALELEPDRQSVSEGLFLAMAHHRRGEPGPARSWYDRASAPLAAEGGLHPDTGRLQAEAAALLGLPSPRVPDPPPGAR